MIVGIQAIDNGLSFAEVSNDNLPWAGVDGDLDWFKYVTNGHIVVGGEKTYQALKGLKNRESWLASRSEGKSAENILKAYATLQEMGDKRNLFICGGEEVWEAFRPHYDAFYLTILNKTYVEPEKSRSWLYTKNALDLQTIIVKENYIVTITYEK